MKKHVVFVDANTAGIFAVELALSRGLRVSFVRSTLFSYLYEGFEANRILSMVDSIIDIDDSRDVNQLEGALERISNEASVDAIIATFEAHVLSTAHIAARRCIRFTSLDAVKSCTNKAQAREILIQHNIPSARFGIAVNISKALEIGSYIGYPIIAKPKSGSGSKIVSRIDSEEQLLNYFEEFDSRLNAEPTGVRSYISKDILLEEYLNGRMMSVEIVGDGHSLNTITIGERKRYSKNEALELGTTIPANITESEWISVDNYAKRVALCLGLDIGVFHIEIMLTSEGPRLVEANPRMIGGGGRRMIMCSYEFDPFDVMIDVHLGIPLSTIIKKHKRVTTAHHIASTQSIATGVNGDMSEVISGIEDNIFDIKIKDLSKSTINAYASNQDSLGVVITCGDTLEVSEYFCDEVLGRIEKSFNIELMK